MPLEKLLETGIIIIVAVMLVVYVPKSKLREALVVFFFKQFVTWPLGLAVAEYGLIEYPVRLFSNATKVQFSFEYLIYPAICVVFMMTYPEDRGRFKEFMHYFNYCTIMTMIEVVAEKYTANINYIHWTWYLTWLSLFITFYISRKFYEWFFRVNAKEVSGYLHQQ
ncbi:MAG: CBO0543 family protein [Syntrophomonadaceae bacterium]